MEWKIINLFRFVWSFWNELRSHPAYGWSFRKDLLWSLSLPIWTACKRWEFTSYTLVSVNCLQYSFSFTVVQSVLKSTPARNFSLNFEKKKYIVKFLKKSVIVNAVFPKNHVRNESATEIKFWRIMMNLLGISTLPNY